MSATAKSLHCLIVEDVEADAQLILRQLRTGGYDVIGERVDTPEAMRAALARQPWDVVLSDYRMPRFSGLAALEILRASGIDLPFMIVSGTIGEEVAVAAMKAGVDDYLIKGELAHLTVAVERELRNAATRREHKAAAAALALNEAKFRAVFDHAPVGISLTLDNEGVVLVNAEHARITGVPVAASFEPGVFHRATHPEDEPRQMAAAIPFINGEVDHYTVEKRYLHPDGHVQWAELTSRFFIDPATKEKWTVTINTDLTTRKQAESQMCTALQEKEALLHEVHHRVKNNLQVISSLLSLEARRDLEPGTKAVLQEMKGRIRSMALLHETLYRTKNFARVDLAGYLREVAVKLFRAQNADPSAVRLVLELAAAEVELDQAMPCGLLINELLTNTLKHGFPDGRHGEVRLGLQQTADGRVHLQVSDDGIGLPADFDLSRANTLGLQLVSDLTRQLQGVMAVGPGASFKIVFTPKLPRARKTNA